MHHVASYFIVIGVLTLASSLATGKLFTLLDLGQGSGLFSSPFLFLFGRLASSLLLVLCFGFAIFSLLPFCFPFCLSQTLLIIILNLSCRNVV